MSVASPKMFAPSTATFDISQLCFKHDHFTRCDFDVRRFMALARLRSDLKTIHSDLQLYLKSLQHSMVELINEDYAHFVHLSSNLVGLKAPIDGIHNNVEVIWKEFNDTAKDAVVQAEKVEERCIELSEGRETQIRLTNQISAVTALKRLKKTLRDAPTPITVIWLERLSSLVTDVFLKGDSLENDSVAKQHYEVVMGKLQTRLGNELVTSLHGDLVLLPLLFSLISLCRSTEILVSRIVSDVIEPLIDTQSSKEPLQLLTATLYQIEQLRSRWSTRLAAHSPGPLMQFLDQCLLTFVLTFIDKSLSAQLTTSPSFFHSAFLATSELITNWPSPKSSSSHLRAIRGRFQLQVYFLQISSASWKNLQEQADPARWECCLKESQHNVDKDRTLTCLFYQKSLTLIGSLWSVDTFLLPLTAKCWDQTTKILSLCISYAKALTTHFSNSSSPSPWNALVCARVDCSRLGQVVFDEALEKIWPRLRELKVETSPFGQTMTAFSSSIEKEGDNIEKSLVSLLSRELDTTLEDVNQIPKQYRWTKRAVPVTQSPYISSALSRLDTVVEEATRLGMETAPLIAIQSLHNATRQLIIRASQVLDTVDATGSSLSRLKRREGTPAEGESDEDKIRTQMRLDLNAILNRLKGEEGIDKDIREDMEKLLVRLQGATRQPNA